MAQSTTASGRLTAFRRPGEQLQTQVSDRLLQIVHPSPHPPRGRFVKVLRNCSLPFGTIQEVVL
jgi:hypothetical protein